MEKARKAARTGNGRMQQEASRKSSVINSQEPTPLGHPRLSNLQPDAVKEKSTHQSGDSAIQTFQPISNTSTENVKNYAREAPDYQLVSKPIVCPITSHTAPPPERGYFPSYANDSDGDDPSSMGQLRTYCPQVMSVAYELPPLPGLGSSSNHGKSKYSSSSSLVCNPSSPFEPKTLGTFNKHLSHDVRETPPSHFSTKTIDTDNCFFNPNGEDSDTFESDASVAMYDPVLCPLTRYPKHHAHGRHHPSDADDKLKRKRASDKHYRTQITSQHHRLMNAVLASSRSLSENTSSSPLPAHHLHLRHNHPANSRFVTPTSRVHRSAILDLAVRHIRRLDRAREALGAERRRLWAQNERLVEQAGEMWRECEALRAQNEDLRDEVARLLMDGDELAEAEEEARRECKRLKDAARELSERVRELVDAQRGEVDAKDVEGAKYGEESENDKK
jgi:hypothetical protein